MGFGGASRRSIVSCSVCCSLCLGNTMPAPPTSESGAERDFLMWVGYCITTWADVEEKLFDVVWKCLQCPKEQAAIIYFRTPGLDARVTLADELVKNILPTRAAPDAKVSSASHRVA